MANDWLRKLRYWTTLLVSHFDPSQIISAATIIAFTEDMDAIMFVLTVVSSVLQLYVIYAAVKHIKRKTSDKVNTVAQSSQGQGYGKGWNNGVGYGSRSKM